MERGMRKWLVCAGVAAMVAGGLGVGHAEGLTRRGGDLGWQVKQPKRFFVSGVLRKDGTTDTIKLLHGTYTADSGDAALQLFIDEAKRQYVGYTLISQLATEVPKVGECELHI